MFNLDINRKMDNKTIIENKRKENFLIFKSN